MKLRVAATIAPTLVLGLLVLARTEPDATDPRPDEYQLRVQALEKRLPEGGKGFTIVVQRPFVVVGDGPPAGVRRRATGIVKWAVDRLKEAYFAKDPDPIIEIYLFKDDASYRRHAKLLFDDEPRSPYGYYSPRHEALVMNIATGGGTLVHEIVHPYVAANFPACPAWFNEGLGSLYEQCGDREGKIVGYVNWRLPILQRAIQAGEVPTFKALCSTTPAAFYGTGRGVHYAQARYLCYHLQEQGLLRAFYRAFVENHEADPSGYQTLVHILEEEDMEAFQKRWATYVLGLDFE